MSARFRQLEALFDAALMVPVAQRPAWAAAECAGDAELERELLALLANDERLARARTANPLHIGERALDAALDAETATGGRLGPYHLREEIGRGGMGRVVRAVRYEGGVEREVAVKFVRRELLDESTRRRFRQELRALASLDHPGIARLLEGGTAEDGTPYVVMELVRGEPLLAYCAKRRLGIRARLELFRQVLAAVAHAHRNLIVHRDIKPANVLVDARDQTRLLDFGLAKPMHADAAETATGERYFTPAYAAPEQLRGESTGVGCDVYSLGALLYELLAGVPPFRFEGRTAAEIERLILAVPPEPLERAAVGSACRTTQHRQLGGDVDAIVQKALRKEPDRRYLSVEQFDEDLERYLLGRPVAAARSTRTYRFRKFVGRNRLAVAVTCVVAASAIAGVAAVVRGAQVAAAERDRAQAALSIVRDAFKGADPMKASGPQVGAREILAAAAERIRAIEEAQPLLFCELATEIVDVQLALGIYESTDALAERALARARSIGVDPELLWRLRYFDMRRLLGLQKMAEVDAALFALEADRPDDRRVLSSRAYYWLVANDPERGIPVAERAIASARAAGDAADVTTARLHLAELMSLAGRRAAALDVFDALIVELTAQHGHDHPRVHTVRLRRVPVLSDLGRHDEATQEALLVARSLPERYGEESAVAARANSVLGHAYLAAGNYIDAVPAFALAARGYARSHGSGHSNTLKARYNVAHALVLSNAEPERIDEAFEQVIHDASPRGSADLLLWYFRTKYAASLVARGALDAARTILLPAATSPDLTSFDDENRAEYVDLVQRAFAPLACGTGRPESDPGRARAAQIVCLRPGT